jgi:hypothetical protein
MAASKQGGRQGAADEAIGASQKNVQAQSPREGTGFGRREYAARLLLSNLHTHKNESPTMSSKEAR